MSHRAIHKVVAGLARARQMERVATEHYNHARHRLKVPAVTSVLDKIESDHVRMIQLVDRERERLQAEAGEGFFGEAAESFSRAFTDVVGHLPAIFIEAETNPTPDTLLRIERHLLEQYESVLELAQEEQTREVLGELIGVCRDHINAITAVDRI